MQKQNKENQSIETRIAIELWRSDFVPLYSIPFHSSDPLAAGSRQHSFHHSYSARMMRSDANAAARHSLGADEPEPEFEFESVAVRCLPNEPRFVPSSFVP
mmetsp:Transcript_21610/g.47212  ORF Transcript_21610/g.47212 Transcript_21610/m.47212 type:complete len:101 (+) Transcript_21610:109-411(+)